MICPNCGHHNPQGRKYCRSCTKALSAEASLKPVAPVSAPPDQYPSVAPRMNKMAVASVAFSFLALLPPFGLAAVVLGHMARSRIAKSEGREKGTGIAFAGLILGYGQLAIFGILMMGALGLVNEFRGDLRKDPDTRAALIDRIAHGDPYEVTPQRTARQVQTAIQMIHLIQAKETEYIGDHPDEGYACVMYKLGAFAGGNDRSQWSELDTLSAQSHYDSKFFGCGQVPLAVPGTQFYRILFTPESEGNGPEAPNFCLDQSDGIVQYSAAESNDAWGEMTRPGNTQCPTIGTHVE